ncbi:MAG: branched-chain amino acid ABC transporter permease [Oscillospiraceae bacterium]|nr:branched-chain amino acid ABC transporter permease [Oscillospiraceae bacterium]
MGQAIINGILLGGLYALVGVGMNVIFGIVKLTNLAHGDFIILASYLSLAVCTSLGIPPLLSLVIVIPIMFFIGFFLQSLLVNRVISRGPEPPLLVMFGLSIVIQNLLLSFFSSDAQHLPTKLDTRSITITDQIAIPTLYLIEFAVGILVIFLLYLFLRRTYVGQSIRATSDDTMAAKLMGINIKTTYGIAMGVAMATAAVAGILIGMGNNFYPTTSSIYLIISFGVVVIGGMGSIRGTLFAGIIFGLALLLGAYFFGTSVQMLCGYLVILVMLIVRPQGLFSK